MPPSLSLHRMIQDSMRAVSTTVNFFFHNLAQLRFKRHSEGRLLSFQSQVYTYSAEKYLSLGFSHFSHWHPLFSPHFSFLTNFRPLPFINPSSHSLIYTHFLCLSEKTDGKIIDWSLEGYQFHYGSEKCYVCLLEFSSIPSPCSYIYLHSYAYLQLESLVHTSKRMLHTPYMFKLIYLRQEEP